MAAIASPQTSNCIFLHVKCRKNVLRGFLHYAYSVHFYGAGAFAEHGFPIERHIWGRKEYFSAQHNFLTADVHFL
jgi:hypothetical protein